uniref:NR LBD domain-containing protein n=1 Tax=Oreochromis aureus TaxID=47969 RepID=A0A668W0H1_OREAU
MSCCECKVTQDTGQGSILYSILNRGALCPQARADTTAAHRCCSCASMRKLVAIRAPQSVIRAACEVLLKTFRFVKNVPCFRGLPADDQLRLVRNSWAPLLLLGLVQDSVDFDTVETQKPSLLHEILTHDANRRERTAGAAQHPGVPLCDVQSIQMFLVKLSFTPVPELECQEYIHALQREAERALYEHVGTVYRGNASRSGKLRVVLSTLRAVDTEAVAGLFLRPVTGTSSIDEHVLAMFCER